MPARRPLQAFDREEELQRSEVRAAEGVVDSALDEARCRRDLVEIRGRCVGKYRPDVGEISGR